MGQRSCILHLRASRFVGGPERQILRYAEYERQGPCDILLGTFVETREGTDFLEAIGRQGFEALALPAGGLGDARAFETLLRFLGKREIALVCTHGYKADLLGTLACRIRQIPVACFLRGWTGEDWKVRAYEALDRALLPLADRIVCLSQTYAEQIGRNRKLAHKLRVVHNAVQVPEIGPKERLRARQALRERFGLPHDSLIVATAGRLSREKGTSYFLEAAAQIRKERPATRFIVFGDGARRNPLRELARILNLESVLHFAGFVSDFRELLPGIDLLVNPSLAEQMPNVVLEGMAAGVPVAATSVGGVAEIAGDKETVVLLPAKCSRAIAQAVIALLRDPARAAALARAGQKRVADTFSPARQQAQLRALYEELIPKISSVHRPHAATAHAMPPRDAQSTAGVESATQLPFLSVVIPVRNEQAHLAALLDDLLAQEYPPDRYEILVVDGGSTDATVEIVQKYAKSSVPRLVLLSNPRRLSSAGRNVGILHSRGEMILFVDGHCRVTSQRLLRDSARLLETTGADCLCRPQPLTVSGNDWFEDLVAHVRATPIGHGLDSTIYATDQEAFVNPTSSGAIYRRTVFNRIGLYDERFDACEDVEFNYRVHRAGLRSYLSPCLTVFYRPRSSLRQLFKQLARYGRGRFRFVCKHLDALSLSQLIPPGVLAWLFIGGLGAVWSPLLGQAVLATLAAYAALVLVFSLWLGLSYGWRHLVVAPLVYVDIHLGLGAGFWAELGQTLFDRLRAFRNRMSLVGISSPSTTATDETPLQHEAKLQDSEISTGSLKN